MSQNRKINRKQSSAKAALTNGRHNDRLDHVDPEIDPPFWKSRLVDIERSLGAVKKGVVEKVGISAGGRPIFAVGYGRPTSFVPRTNFSGAVAAGNLKAFFGRNGEPESSALIIAAEHGAEMEGIAAALDLIALLETGKDLRGKSRPGLVRAARRLRRLLVVPCANPDGRARVKVGSLVGRTLRDLRYWGQGWWKNGRLIGWPRCKSFQPLPLEKVAFLGGYPNDDGYNMILDAAPGGTEMPETRALFRLLRRERPRVTLHLHSFQGGGGVLPPAAFLPPECREQVFLFARRTLKELAKASLRPSDMGRAGGWALNFIAAGYFATGTLPIAYESPHGLRECPFSHAEILDSFHVLFQTFLTMIAKDELKLNYGTTGRPK